MGKTSSAGRDLTGEELAGRYVLLQRIHGDAVSSVYQAQDAKLMRRVAVRVPGPDALSRPGFVERFARALRSVSDLQHEALVGVVDFGEHDGVPFAVVHRASGSSLEKHLAELNRPMTMEEVSSWLSQVAAALDYLHDKGESYGDPTPDCIFLDDPPSTKACLTDFTMRRALESQATDAASDQRGLAACAAAALGGGEMPTPAGKALEQARGPHPFASCGAFAAAFSAGAGPAERGPLRTKSDSETLGFGRPRPATAEPATTTGTSANADPFATRPVLMRGRRSGGSRLILAGLGILLLGAILFVVFGGGGREGPGNLALDEIPPHVEILEPAIGHRTREAEITVAGTTDDAKAIVLVDDNPVAVGEDGQFRTITRIPAEGEQTIVILARDEAGNETRKVRTVTRDATPPALEIVAPTPGALAKPTTAPTVIVSGIVGEPGALVEVDGKTVDVTDEGRFSIEVAIPKNGANEIRVSARDAVGNEVTRSVVALRRLVVCCETLAITTPLDGDATRADEIVVVGLMEDPRATIEINGQATRLDRDGVFRGTVRLEDEGTHVIVVRASDPDGHEGEAHVRVTRDLTAPELHVSDPTIWARAPTKAFLTSTGPLELAGTLKDATRCTVYVNGQRGSVSGNAWEAIVNISSGEKFVRVWAVDAAGNKSTVVRHPIVVPRARIKGMTYKGKGEDGYDLYTLDKDPTVEFVLVPEGGYRRGSPPDDEHASAEERPRQWVVISAFLIGRTEITWAQYLRFCRDRDHQLPPGMAEDRLQLDHPANQVTWEDAATYCAWAGLRLPTESEWEYAARFGTEGGRWPWGNAWTDDAANVASVRGNTTSVASYVATGELGLFDIVGNVAEWCADRFGASEYEDLPEQDPQGPAEGANRVVRGGSWQDPVNRVRLSARMGLAPGTRRGTLGFRVAADAPSR